jgi:hypothetical protein
MILSIKHPNSEFQIPNNEFRLSNYKLTINHLSFTIFFRHTFSSNKAARPSRLKIEAACDGIYI